MVNRTTLIVPNDPMNLGGPSEEKLEGFTLLARDDKGALVRLDKDFPNSPLGIGGKVVYGAIAKDARSIRVIRLATDEDRHQRFRRPAHVDKVTVNCCAMPSSYLSIYDETTGSYYDLNVTAQEARKISAGNLYYHFFCKTCCSVHTLLVDKETIIDQE